MSGPSDTELVDFVEEHKLIIRHLPQASAFGIHCWAIELPSGAITGGNTWREAALVAYDLIKIGLCVQKSPRTT